MWLRNDQFERIAALLPGKVSDPGRTAADNRLFVEAVLWIARTGSPWRDLPPEFGPWNSVYQRFARWSRRGNLASCLCPTGTGCRFRRSLHRQHHCSRSPACGGCTQKNGDQALGRSRGGLSTKIPALVEGLGTLARFHLTGGQAGDSPQALPLLGDLQPDSLSADKAYDTDAILDYLADKGIEAVIPPRKHRIVQRSFDQHKYKNRSLIERFFCRIKHFRRIATRYDKLAERFSSFVALAAAVIWLT